MSARTHLEWPGWATWALVLVALTCLASIGATLNDIW
jgi:4-hydroxybenzoate polyprenyltransferase